MTFSPVSKSCGPLSFEKIAMVSSSTKTSSGLKNSVPSTSVSGWPTTEGSRLVSSEPHLMPRLACATAGPASTTPGSPVTEPSSSPSFGLVPSEPSTVKIGLSDVRMSSSSTCSRNSTSNLAETLMLNWRSSKSSSVPAEVSSQLESFPSRPIVSKSMPSGFSRWSENRAKSSAVARGSVSPTLKASQSPVSPLNWKKIWSFSARPGFRSLPLGKTKNPSVTAPSGMLSIVTVWLPSSPRPMIPPEIGLPSASAK